MFIFVSNFHSALSPSLKKRSESAMKDRNISMASITKIYVSVEMLSLKPFFLTVQTKKYALAKILWQFYHGFTILFLKADCFQNFIKRYLQKKVTCQQSLHREKSKGKNMTRWRCLLHIQLIPRYLLVLNTKEARQSTLKAKIYYTVCLRNDVSGHPEGNPSRMIDKISSLTVKQKFNSLCYSREIMDYLGRGPSQQTLQ